MRVLITGSSGYIGSRLLPLMLEAGDTVIGVDINPPSLSNPRFEFHQMDIRDPALESLFQGVDVVLHLAFVVDPLRDKEKMASIDIDGTSNVLSACAKHGISRLVVASSATVFGAHPDNPVPLNEDSPTRPNPEHVYACHKETVERLVADFSRENTGCQVLVLRPVIVMGRRVDNFMSRYLEFPIVPVVKDKNPPLQFVHE